MNEHTDISRIRSRVSGDGLPLILLPGLGLNLHIFDELVARLETEYQCICLDFSSDMSAASASDCTIESLTDDVYAWICAQDISPHCIIGHSFGGFIAMQMATKYPEFIGALILMSTVAQSSPDIADFLLPSEILPAEELRRRNIEMSVSDAFKHTDAFQKVLAAQAAYPGYGKGFMPILRAATRFNIVADLHAIECPTLIISGRDDAIATPKHTAQLASRIRSNIMITFEHVGHLPQVEVPQQTAVGILSFLKKVVTGLITMPIVPPVSQS